MTDDTDPTPPHGIERPTKCEHDWYFSNTRNTFYCRKCSAREEAQ